MCEQYHLTLRQARRFLLLKHGLLGAKKFSGKQGAYQFVRQAGCIQFDPVDVCGKNAELTLQSRVKGFTKQTLYALLYEDRRLVDYPDKNLSIIPAEDWPYFARYREAARQNGSQFADLERLETFAREYIEKCGPVSSETLPVEGRIHWHSAIHWSGSWGGETNAARAVLEQLYSAGELIIHHKEGARKFYDLASCHLDGVLLNTPDPLPDEAAHRKWRVLRRIGAIGLLWNRPSDAWLNIWGMKAEERKAAFQTLLEEKALLTVRVSGIKESLFCQAEDRDLLTEACSEKHFTRRCELLAPLDPLLWDTRLIEALFGFSYKWEIYTPVGHRKYGYYTLPILYGERFAGRAEIVCERKEHALTVKNIWLERKVSPSFADAFRGCIARFAKFNACESIQWEKAAEGALLI